LDVFDGIRHLINEDQKVEQKKIATINFSSGKTISMIETAMIVKKVFEGRYNKEAVVFINENQPIESIQYIFPSTYSINNSRFNKLIGDRELHSLSYGILEVFDFLDKQHYGTIN
jgi:nucleoside-diphosphate-sugar epimerase